MDAEPYAFLSQAIERDAPGLDEEAVAAIHRAITRGLPDANIYPVEPFLDRYRKIAAWRGVLIEFQIDANRVLFLRLPPAFPIEIAKQRLVRLLGPTSCLPDYLNPSLLRVTTRNPDMEAVRTILLAASFIEF